MRHPSVSLLALFTVMCWGPLAHGQAKPPADKTAQEKPAQDKASPDKASTKAAPDKAAGDKAGPDKAAEGTGAAGADAAESADAKPEPPSPETVKRAGSHFERGLQLYNDAEYRLALIEFERAYQLVPNYKVQYNIAQVSIQIGRYARAVHALEQYLKDGGADVSPERRAQVENDLKMLAGRTARVNILSNVQGAEILLDETTVAQVPMTEKLLIDAGEHRLTVRARGYQPRVEQVTLAGGDDVEFSFDLTEVKKEDPVVIVKEVQKPGDQAPVEDEFPYITVGWVTTGVLAAGAVTAGVVGLSAKNDLDDLAQPDPDQDPEQVKREQDAAKKKAQDCFLAADILTGAAVVAGAASLYFTIVGASEDSPDDDAKDVAKGFSVRPGVGLNHVWVEGSF
ncbi:MAG TPA: PEGA domain-containing protein [Polyangiaceae bacterium]|nr:PEGA domain-containing protein [Polyangiaceae bacterium]